MLLKLLRPILLIPLMLLLLSACDSIEERVSGHYERGLSLLEEGESAKAVLEFLNALKLDDKHAPSHFALGQIDEANGNLKGAFGRFQKAAELQPDNIEARIKVVRFLLVGQASEEAATQMEAVLKLDPNRADVQALNASIALQTGDLEAARSALDLALTLDPDSIDAALAEIGYLVAADQLASARGRADAALTLHPENLALHLLKIQILEKQGDQAGIGAQLTSMIEIFPDEIRYREARARWAVRAGDTAVAEEDLRALVDVNPGDTARVATLIRFLRQKDGDTAARAELAALASREDNTLDYELMLAQFDIETGNKDDAIAYLRTLIERPGGQQNEVRVALARLLLQQGLTEEAHALVREILAEDPKNTEALLMEIARQIDAGELEEAIDNIRVALNEAPNDVRLLQLAARAQELSGNLDLANDRYASAVRADAYASASVDRYVQFLMRSERFTAAQTVLSEALSRNPTDVNILNLLATIRVRLRDWLGAEEAVRVLESFNPARARQLRAAILIAQEQFDAGADLLREGAEVDSQGRARSVAALVQLLIAEGKIDEATQFLADLLVENPRNVQAIGLQGNLHLAAGDYEAAAERYRTILEIEPENGSAHSALSRLFAQQGDEKAAEAQLLTGLETSPDNLILLSRLAEVYTLRGEFEDSIEIYERLYKLVPNSLLIANNLASLLSDHRADDPVAVDRAYAIAGRLRNSDIPNYRDTYGWTRYLEGEYQEALDRIKPVAEISPDNPWIQYHLGMIYVALKQPAGARVALQAALDKSEPELFPPTDLIQETLQKLGTQ